MVVNKNTERKVLFIKFGSRGGLNRLEQIVSELGFETVTALNYTHLVDQINSHDRRYIKGIIYEILPQGEILIFGEPKVYPMSLINCLSKKLQIFTPFIAIYSTYYKNEGLESSLYDNGAKYVLKYPMDKEDICAALEKVGLLPILK